ncbi:MULTISPECIES: hypothetical protein [Pseudomonas]|jgi:hypothetical protein|uniref:hypothetical protein n=1 Tax=Pseudomonas TaxID=286 RepID=UPI0002D701EB|nr:MULTISPECIES: hypothetical protein [Pseudomonas]APC20343.1 hypothetical protein BME99_06065 [Pseudomonas protegens]MBP5103365.1 hypothetical protein [Pseudomonas protegens]MBP5118567.1 hypothetical protein [Pseudomonas protegens]MBP5123426.1 hypothetical protein [Pseudomonas protegens]MBP5128755.1 hypothetical protein [Pseudomonas protegens]
MSLDAASRYQVTRILTGLAPHCLPPLLFYYAHVWGIPVYRSHFGALAKGFGLGMMVELLLQLLIVVSFLQVLVPQLKVKLVLIGTLALFTAWAMFPDHPIRGYVYCFLMTVPPLLAIWLAQGLCRLCLPGEQLHAQ